MRILQNLTRSELDAYVKQPTAKKLRDKTVQDGVFIPSGDKDAAAVYVAGRQKVSETAGEGWQDVVELSSDGDALKAQERETEAAAVCSYTRIGDSCRYRLQFANTAMINRAVKQGYVTIEGQRVDLSDEVKKQLIAAGKEIDGVRKRISAHNFLLHEAANAQQNRDAMQEESEKMSRVMQTASRIMHGRKVSPADEKELMEFNKDLYAMAKNAAALEKYRHKHDDREDERISAENERARERAAEPKDYSVEETPMPNMTTEMTVDLEGEMPQIDDVGAVLRE
ncbi:MAG: hypothetical protein E7201_10225 [Selenomonas ruminantium]|jgi:hypothetical protein|uniref:Uncharacterized protein n=1 Tax=Selenomonas ruminantium TaxID=971 RepID=A0A927ZS20_SELRU|nr:hypothetical protein [Selenomonas ruminantium]